MSAVVGVAAGSSKTKERLPKIETKGKVPLAPATTPRREGTRPISGSDDDEELDDDEDVEPTNDDAVVMTEVESEDVDRAGVFLNSIVCNGYRTADEVIRELVSKYRYTTEDMRNVIDGLSYFQRILSVKGGDSVDRFYASQYGRPCSEMCDFELAGELRGQMSVTRPRSVFELFAGARLRGVEKDFKRAQALLHACAAHGWCSHLGTGDLAETACWTLRWKVWDRDGETNELYPFLDAQKPTSPKRLSKETVLAIVCFRPYSTIDEIKGSLAREWIDRSVLMIDKDVKKIADILVRLREIQTFVLCDKSVYVPSFGLTRLDANSCANLRVGVSDTPRSILEVLGNAGIIATGQNDLAFARGCLVGGSCSAIDKWCNPLSDDVFCGDDTFWVKCTGMAEPQGTWCSPLRLSYTRITTNIANSWSEQDVINIGCTSALSKDKEKMHHFKAGFIEGRKPHMTPFVPMLPTVAALLLRTMRPNSKSGIISARSNAGNSFLCCNGPPKRSGKLAPLWALAAHSALESIHPAFIYGLLIGKVDDQLKCDETSFLDWSLIGNEIPDAFRDPSFVDPWAQLKPNFCEIHPSDLRDRAISAVAHMDITNQTSLANSFHISLPCLKSAISLADGILHGGSHRGMPLFKKVVGHNWTVEDKDHFNIKADLASNRKDALEEIAFLTAAAAAHGGIDDSADYYRAVVDSEIVAQLVPPWARTHQAEFAENISRTIIARLGLKKSFTFVSSNDDKGLIINTTWESDDPDAQRMKHAAETFLFAVDGVRVQDVLIALSGDPGWTSPKCIAAVFRAIFSLGQSGLKRISIDQSGIISVSKDATCPYPTPWFQRLSTKTVSIPKLEGEAGKNVRNAIIESEGSSPNGGSNCEELARTMGTRFFAATQTRVYTTQETFVNACGASYVEGRQRFVTAVVGEVVWNAAYFDLKLGYVGVIDPSGTFETADALATIINETHPSSSRKARPEKIINVWTSDKFSEMNPYIGPQTLQEMACCETVSAWERKNLPFFWCFLFLECLVRREDLAPRIIMRVLGEGTPFETLERIRSYMWGLRPHTPAPAAS
jgi:hypothetical protein